MVNVKWQMEMESNHCVYVMSEIAGESERGKMAENRSGEKENQPKSSHENRNCQDNERHFFPSRRPRELASLICGDI